MYICMQGGKWLENGYVCDSGSGSCVVEIHIWAHPPSTLYALCTVRT